MGSKSSIEWTDATWNPIRGCSMAKGSEKGGCLNCYAARFNARNLPGMRSPTTGKPFAILRPSGPRWTGDVELIRSQLDLPFRWKKPRRIFVNSQSDLFHEWLSFEEIDEVLCVAVSNPQHTYQILTKRAKRMHEYFNSSIERSVYTADQPNIWFGVSVEDQDTADARIPWLLNSPVALRFVSYEPALGPVEFTRWLSKLDWVIVGGESGPGARPFDVKWVDALIEQLSDPIDTLLFVKQLGAVPTIHDPYKWNHIASPRFGRKLATGTRIILKDRKGGNWDEWPEKYRIRQIPIIPSVADRMAEAGF